MKTLHSTRNKELKVSFHEAVLQGIASDGGLFVKSSFENCQINMAALVNASYQDIAQAVLSTFIDDFDEKQIQDCIHHAYGRQFDTTDIAPLVKVGSHHILELFHGPTCAFKDMALQILPYFMRESLMMEKVSKDILILTATSGDTGKAALEGFKDVEHVNIIVFYPHQLVSETQERQMITTTGKNTSVVALHGNFDDAQRAVKQAFSNPELNKEINSLNCQFSSANSINIGRLCPQIVYYFSSYLQLVKKGEISLNEEINFVVPTGNFGNILAGYYAKLMGLPVHRLICASNQNHILDDFFKTGVYDRNRPLEKTISPSMDILVSSNLERLLYQMNGENCEEIAQWMKELNETGKYAISSDLLNQLQSQFVSGYASDEDCQKMISTTYQTTGYIMDPHTACAAKVLNDYLEKTQDSHKNIILSTASPYKFSKDVYHAIKADELDSEWDYMEALSQCSNLLAGRQLAALKDAPVLHHIQTDLDNINEVILSILKEKAQ